MVLSLLDKGCPLECNALGPEAASVAQPGRGGVRVGVGGRGF